MMPPNVSWPSSIPPRWRFLVLRCCGLGPDGRERCRGLAWTIRESGHAYLAPNGASVNSQGREPLVCWRDHLRIKFRPEKGGGSPRGRRCLVREGLALVAVPGAREPLVMNRDPIRGRGVGGEGPVACVVVPGATSPWLFTATPFGAESKTAQHQNWLAG